MKTVIQIEVENGELEQILKELSEAQEKIYQCYSKLKAMGVLKVKQPPAAEAASDK